jgi:hypothetical protein
MMDPSVASAAGPALTSGIKGSDVSFGTPKFVATFNEYVKGKSESGLGACGALWRRSASVVSRAAGGLLQPCTPFPAFSWLH